MIALEHKTIRGRPGADCDARLNHHAAEGWRLDKIVPEQGVWWMVLVRPRLRYVSTRRGA